MRKFFSLRHMNYLRNRAAIFSAEETKDVKNTVGDSICFPLVAIIFLATIGHCSLYGRFCISTISVLTSALSVLYVNDTFVLLSLVYTFCLSSASFLVLLTLERARLRRLRYTIVLPAFDAPAGYGTPASTFSSFGSKKSESY